MTATGIGLLAAFVVWAQVSAAVSGGNGAPLGLLATAAGVTFAISRRVSRRRGWVVPAALTVSAAVGMPTIGYANAACALLVLGAAAALMLAARDPHSAVRPVSFVAFAGFATTVLMSDCRAAAVGIAIVGLGALARETTARKTTARAVCLGGAALVVVALAVSTAMGAWSIGAGRSPSNGTRLVDLTLTSVRVELWHDALAMVRVEPLTGVGPGRFAALSPTAQRNDDWRWAHHGFLQLTAETGLVGLALGLALVAWVFVWLGRVEPNPGSVIAALALTALLVNACIDYILHVPAVTLAAAALAGAGAPELLEVGIVPLTCGNRVRSCGKRRTWVLFIPRSGES